MAYTKLEDLTKEQAVELHKKLWERMAEIAESGEMPTKERAVEDLGYHIVSVECCCFLCAYGAQQIKKYLDDSPRDIRLRACMNGAASRCDWCPVDWNPIIKVNNPCTVRNTVYDTFNSYKHRFYGKLYIKEYRDKVAGICREIANLPLAVADEGVKQSRESK